MPEVIFITRELSHYRVPFHETVRNLLSANKVNYRLIYSEPSPREAAKKDTAKIDWAEEVKTFYFGAEAELCWQRVLGHVRHSDLIVIGQENKLLSNYPLYLRRALGGPRLAFFGHGKNFQAANPNSFSERFKRLLVNKVDWWFAYTERSADIVAQSGFPRDRITVFNNSIDTSSIRMELASIDPVEENASRQLLLSGSHKVGVYVGGLYPLKRIAFMLEAAKRVRELISDFHLLVIGAGEDTGMVVAAAEEHEWIHYVGPKFGREKTLLTSLGRVFLMPGLVGLGILDSFAYGTPMVTTDVSFHSPEIEYLKDGTNGVIVKDCNNVGAYAEAVARILHDDTWREHLRTGAAEALHTYTIEKMAERFATGVLGALTV